MAEEKARCSKLHHMRTLTNDRWLEILLITLQVEFTVLKFPAVMISGPAKGLTVAQDSPTVLLHVA